MGKSIISLSFAVCLLSFASCKDGGSGGLLPPSKLDKIVFTQTTGGGDYVAMTLGKEDEINVTTEPIPGMPAPPPDKFKFLSMSLVDNTITQLTPELTKDSASHKLGLAPNGDFWFWTDQGLFISNVNSKNPRPQMLLPISKMAKDFVKGSDDSVYKAAMWFANTVKFIPTKDQKNYWAFIQYDVYGKSKSSGLEVKQSVIIKYDSKDGSFKPLLPFAMDWEGVYAEAMVQTATPNAKPDQVQYGTANNIKGLKDDGFYYVLDVSKVEDNEFLVKYDPSEDKHYLELPFLKSDNIPLTNCSFEAGKCRMAQYQTVTLTPLDCGKPTKEDAAACINEKFAAKKVEVYDVKMMNKAVSLQSKEDVFMLLGAGEAEKKAIASIDWTQLYKISTDDIFCNQATCYFPVSVSGTKDIWFTVSPVRIGKEWIGFAAYNSKGAERFYTVNYTNGEVKLFADNSVKGSWVELLDFGNDRFAYEAGVFSGDKTGEKQLFIFSPKDGSPIEILAGGKEINAAKGYSEDDYFVEKTSEGDFFSKSITYDGSRVFLRADGKPYYINVNEVVPGKETNLNSAITSDAANANFKLRLLWKGYALWEDANTYNFYINRPFETDKSAKLVMAEEEGKWPGFELAGTVAEFEPPADIGFDISANFEELFKCGAGGDYALWCENDYYACENGQCVDKLACSSNDECAEGYVCQGHCVWGTVEPPDEPETKQCDPDGPCNEKFECSVDGMCIPDMGAITVNVDKTPIYSASSVDYKAMVSWEKVTDYEGNVIDSYIVTSGTGGEKKIDGNSTEITFSVPGATKQMGFSVKVRPLIEGLGDIDKEKTTATSNTIMLENKDHCMLKGYRTAKCPQGLKCDNDICQPRPEYKKAGRKP